MKTKLTYPIIVLLVSITPACAQETTAITKSDAKDLKGEGMKVNSNVIKMGLSLGFNYLTKDLHDATLSVVDNSLKLQKVNPVSFLLSTAVVVNPIKSFYRKLDAHGNAVGEVYSVPSRLSFVATVNLAQFGSEGTTFNKKIDGGLGFGIRLSEDFHLALTAEMISARQLRNYAVDEFENKPIVIDNETLNALDVKDDRLFVDNYYFGLSVKFIYILVGKDTDSSDQ